MTGPSSYFSVFSNLIGQMGSDRLMPGVQFHTLANFSRILDSVPECGEAASLVRAQLSSLGAVEKVDAVEPRVVAALRGALPILERAMSSPSEEAAAAFDRLKRIAFLTSNSQTMSAVLDTNTVSRARDTMRPRVESPAVRRIEKMFRGNDQRVRSSGTVFFINGKPVHLYQWDELLALLSGHFGSTVTRDDLENLFHIGQRDYRIAMVDVRRESGGDLRIQGQIRREQEPIGYFAMSIPPAPPPGTHWRVKVETIANNRPREGIGSRLLASLALFLHDRGVHSIKANAMEGAGLFSVFNGFRLEKALYEQIVDEFLQESERKNYKIAREDIHRLLDREANLAELAAFEWNGRNIGREFLGELFTRKYLPLRFELSADKQSWLRLLSNLHRADPDTKIPPLEWDRLHPVTRQMLFSGVHFIGGNVPSFMSSDRDHAVHLMERLNNWAQSLSFMMDLPEGMLDRMPSSRRQDFDAMRAACQDVLAMIAQDQDSPLFSHFSDLMNPIREKVTGDSSTNRAFFIAGTILKAEKRGLLHLPGVLHDRFEELVSRVY